MENAKRKRREVVNKNYGNNLGGKPQKKTKKKTARKENIKTPIAGHECSELTAQRGGDVGLRVAKDRRDIQGIFFKGLRSQFITRRALNEVNEARKKEDIYRIIDVGKIFFQKEERLRNHVSGYPASRKTQKPSASNDFTRSGKELEYFLSPISVASVRVEVHPLKDQYETSIRRKKLDLKKELQAFSLKYEEAVRTHILHKLPEKGVLEDALKALNSLHHAICFDSDSSKSVAVEKETAFASPQKEEHHLRKEVSFNENSLSVVGVNLFPGDFTENPPKDVFIIKHPVTGNETSKQGLVSFSDCDKNRSQCVTEFREKDFQKSVKELDIVTPPIHFYRRNMF